MIDTHCHLTSKQLVGNVERVIESASEVGVTAMISIATGSNDSLEAQKLANQFEQVYFSSGIHPLYADEQWEWEHVLSAAMDPKCVAWGELGLDRHYSDPPFHLQMKLLEKQLELIESQKEDSRPIIVHCRRAVEDLLPMFKQSSISGDRFVFHCFTETLNEARLILDFGSMISYTGVVTYKNASQVVAAAEFTPLDRMMVETDAPYLSPEPVRTTSPNEPQFVVHTAAFLANLKGVSEPQFEKQMDENACSFFKLILN